MGYHAARQGRERETVTAEQYADGMMEQWLEKLREEVRTQLFAATRESALGDVALTSHLTGNLIYTLRACAETAYDAGWRAGNREAR